MRTARTCAIPSPANGRGNWRYIDCNSRLPGIGKLMLDIGKMQGYADISLFPCMKTITKEAD